MRRISTLLAALLVLGACSASSGTQPSDDDAFEADVSDEEAANDSVKRGCKVSEEIVARIWRGFDPKHSEDVTAVPREPNFWGSFAVVSHSGPWDYLQRVPLIIYGPGRIDAQGAPLQQEASLADVYPTIGELLGADLKERTGTTLSDALGNQIETPPRLILTIMWDGVGRNMLDRFPGSWPTVARLEAEGTSYLDATVGSSPSITPATHATLGTGAFPRDHKVTAIEYRYSDRKVGNVTEGRNMRNMKLTTYADQFDKQVGNRSRVGALVWRDWHMPMMGHGSQTNGGDKDHLAVINEDGKVNGNPAFYKTPSYVKGHERLFEGHVDELDRADGEADGKWRGHDIVGAYEDNPAYVRYQGDLALKMLRKGKYGKDDIPDLFFANFKQTDIAGHQYTIDSPEVRDVLREQDEQLARMLRYLDRKVQDYVLILSADHGHTPDPFKSGGWPIDPKEFKADAYAHFKVPSGEKLFESTTAVGPFINRAVATEYGVTPRQMARFMENYRLKDNWPDGEPLPKEFRSRANERVFEAAWAAEDLDEIVACHFPDGLSG